MDAGTITEQAAPTYFPVALESIDERILEMDLYLKSGTVHVLYRATGVEFTPEDRRRLIEQGVKFLYVPVAQHAAYRKTLCDRLERLFSDPQRSREERARLVRQSCQQMIQELLLFPGEGVHLTMIEDVSRQFVRWSSESSSDFSYLLDMSAHDYYTVTHLVNTGVATALLARELYPDDPDFQSRLVQGALLHDVGKRLIPQALLNKSGKLKPTEWAVMSQHPVAGYEELAQQVGMPAEVLEMARDHHERLDGSGYPRGLKGDEIGIPARICAVVDVYDAIASTRPYRGPTPPRRALEIMRESVGKHLDPQIFEAWAALVDRLLSEDPERAVPETFDPGPLALGDLVESAPLPRAHAAARGAHSLAGENLRRFERAAFVRTLRVRFVRQYKSYAVREGDWFTLETVDLSRSGIQFRTPWPLSLNDVLEIELARPGRPNPLACVVRVRQGDRDTWLAGMQFVSRQEFEKSQAEQQGAKQPGGAGRARHAAAGEVE